MSKAYRLLILASALLVASAEVQVSKQPIKAGSLYSLVHQPWCSAVQAFFYFPPQPVSAVQVTCGSLIKLAHDSTKALLHSHDIAYGTGSGQQSVTGYPELGDANSLWIVRAAKARPCTLAARGLTSIECDKVCVSRMPSVNRGRRYPVAASYACSMRPRASGYIATTLALRCPTTRRCAQRKQCTLQLFMVPQVLCLFQSGVLTGCRSAALEAMSSQTLETCGR